MNAELELIQQILQIDHALAPDVAQAMANGLAQEVTPADRKQSLARIKVNTDNRNNESAADLFLFLTDRKLQFNYPPVLIARMLVLHHFHFRENADYSDVETLGFFSPEYNADRSPGAKQIFIDALYEERWNLKEYPLDLRSDRDVVLAAVTESGYALQYASEELRADKEVAMEAVKQWGYALSHASEELQNDLELKALAEKSKK